MKTATKQIHELLYMTPEVYEDDYTERYMRWCMNYAKNFETDLQKILANRSIANYYNTNFHKVQLKFIAAAMPIHGSVKYTVIRVLYGSITSEIFTNYPISLFEEARKLSIINQN